MAITEITALHNRAITGNGLIPILIGEMNLCGTDDRLHRTMVIQYVNALLLIIPEMCNSTNVDIYVTANLDI